jgi:hypothetical protein
VDRGFLANALAALVVIFERLGRVTPAAILYGAVMREFGTLAALWELPEASARIRQATGDSEFQRLADEAATMPLFEVVRYAESEIRSAMTSDSSQQPGEETGPSR